jgi:hypothetical protein
MPVLDKNLNINYQYVEVQRVLYLTHEYTRKSE